MAEFGVKIKAEDDASPHLRLVANEFEEMARHVVDSGNRIRENERQVADAIEKKTDEIVAALKREEAARKEAAREEAEAAKMAREATVEGWVKTMGLQKAGEENNRDLIQSFRDLSDTQIALPGGFSASFGALATAATAAGVAIAAAFVKAGEAIWSASKGAAEFYDTMGESAQRVGVSVEFMSRMSFAAEQAGTSIGAVENAIKLLSKNADNGSKAFEQYGINIRDTNGNLKDGEELFVEVADRINAIHDPIQRVAAAQAFWGKSGTQMLPLITSLRELSAESDRLGGTVTAAQEALGNDFMNALQAVTTSWGALLRSFADPIIPAFTEAMRDIASVFGTVQQAVKDFSGELGTAVHVMAYLNPFTRLATGAFDLYRSLRSGKADTNGAADAFQDLASSCNTAEAASSSLYTETQKTTGELAAQEKLAKEVAKAEKEWADEAQKAADATARIKEKKARDHKAEQQRIANEAKQNIGQAASEMHTILGVKRQRYEYQAKLAEDEAKREQSASKSAVDSVISEIERAKDQQQAIANARVTIEAHASNMSADEQIAAMRRVDAAQEKLYREIERNAKHAARSTWQMFKSSFRGVIDGTESVGDAFKNLLAQMLERILDFIAEQALTGFFKSIAGSLGGFGGLFGAIFGFENGGMVGPGGRPIRMAGGGILSGGAPGVDSIPVLAQQGESFLDVNLTRQLRSALSVPAPSHAATGGVVTAGTGGVGTTVHQNFMMLTGSKAAFRRMYRDEFVPAQKSLKRSRIIK